MDAGRHTYVLRALKDPLQLNFRRGIPFPLNMAYLGHNLRGAAAACIHLHTAVPGAGSGFTMML